MNWPTIDVWRMSASRPWQLKQTHNDLVKHLKYSGKLRYHLIESILVPTYSKQCIRFGEENGYNVHVINPARGQGYACHYAMQKVIKSEFALKWEDDFKPRMDIPLDDCILAMQEHKSINQICFNKRPTLEFKWHINDQGVRDKWYKEQIRISIIDDTGEKFVHLVTKEKWWFGSSLWRISFIKPIFQYTKSNTHNTFNDRVILPMAGFEPGVGEKLKGRHVPTPAEIRAKIGCYIYGKTGDPPMVEHTGREDSIFAGKFKKKMQAEGKTIIGD